jgi:hypothetical protein
MLINGEKFDWDEEKGLTHNNKDGRRKLDELIGRDLGDLLTQLRTEVKDKGKPTPPYQ